MISMQYSFALPADYDMDIIDRRIRDKGPALDGYPHLGFKSYLSARKGESGSSENLYAPFYLWQEPEGVGNFLCGPGFAAVTQAFGWPQVKTWIVWQAEISPEIAKAKFATRETLQIAAHAPLADIRSVESEATRTDVETGNALASVAGFEPTTWTHVRFRLWADSPEPAAATQIYRIGHISLP